ncbi:hypothetical protein [Bacillus haynesii]|uniref:hypothetical protein n=1 Tax=Bacillus haynesii TaxID=1925021 RepID=UPI0022808E0F|nr:hypothetical protein [Bacillus haynesii]MCY9322057.1 hypothetical protein [Bacillus haynesii]
MKATTKPVISSPLGEFAGRVLFVFGNFEKRCLFAEEGAPFPRRLLPKDFHRGVSLLDRLAPVAVNLVMASIAKTFEIRKV